MIARGGHRREEGARKYRILRRSGKRQEIRSTRDFFGKKFTLAAYLGGLKKATLERWRSAGGGPVFYKLGGRCFYRKEDLDVYARSRRRWSTSDLGGGSSEK